MDSSLIPYFCLMDRNFIKKIKSVCFSGPKMLMITKSDEVFGLGRLPDSSRYTNIFEIRPIHELDRKQVKKFIFGDDFVIALTEKGELFSWGENNEGQLGLNSYSKIDSPIKISALPQEREVIDVACGSAHAMVLCKNNSVYTWGKHSEISPKPILKDETKIGMKRIACSAQGLFGLKLNGKVYGKGYLFKQDTAHYSIGNGYSTDNHSKNWPPINSLNNIVKIAAGRYHVIALDGDGAVFVWGSNENGQLTNAIPKYQPSPVKLPNISKKIIDIAANLETDLSAVMTENFEIYVWGKVFHGEALFEPILTSFTSFNEVFVKLSHPSLSLEPITLNTAEKIKNTNNRSLESIFDVQEDSDFTISIEDKNIFVIKAVLKANSEYFHAMFTNDWKDSKERVLKIDGYSYNSFRSFLLYLYTGKIDITTENVFELMKIADKYSDDALSALVEEKIENCSISKGLVKIVKDIMTLSPEDYEKLCDGMKKS